jgi:hypothetical protein
VPGDCGAWVIDALTGSFYGHVVAGNSSLHRAYIIPAAEVVYDIQEKLGHEVTLPKKTDHSERGKLVINLGAECSHLTRLKSRRGCGTLGVCTGSFSPGQEVDKRFAVPGR